MWLANFEDGNAVSSKNTYWTQLKERSNGKLMTALQLSCPIFPELSLCLSDLDHYYFVVEAVSFIGGSKSGKEEVVAEIIGGHNNELGIGVELRLEYSGSVKPRVYNVSHYKYSQEILVPGIRRR